TADRLRDEQAVRGGGRVELHELQIRQRGADAPGGEDAAAEGARGVGGRGVEAAQPAGGQDDRVGADHVAAGRPYAGDHTPGRDELADRRVLADVDPRRREAADQVLGQPPAARVATGVQDAAPGVCGLEPAGERAVGVAVEG